MFLFPQSLKVKKLYYDMGKWLAKYFKFLLFARLVFSRVSATAASALDPRTSMEDVQALEIRIPCIRHHLCHASRMKISALSAAAPTDRTYKTFDGHTSGLLFRPGSEAPRGKCSKPMRLVHYKGVGNIKPRTRRLLEEYRQG
jgi:hypothetical protein